tara:strand:- start:324 stop:494 length:171 start_codon:yes stop_codon:yes gene_type:complete
MNNEIKNKLNNKYKLPDRDIEIISVRIEELKDAIREVLDFEIENNLTNNPLEMKNE